MSRLLRLRRTYFSEPRWYHLVWELLCHPVLWLATSAVLMVLIFVMVDSAKRKEWEEFKIKHSCKIVAKISSSMSLETGVSSSGNVVVTPITIPEKTGWLCDDGVTYYR